MKRTRNVKRTRKVNATLTVSISAPRPGLTQKELNALKKAFKNKLVATLSAHEWQALGPQVKQKQSSKQKQNAKVKSGVRAKAPAARRRVRKAGPKPRRTRKR
jgi:hypothetical protein